MFEFGGIGRILKLFLKEISHAHQGYILLD